MAAPLAGGSQNSNFRAGRSNRASVFADHRRLSRRLEASAPECFQVVPEVAPYWLHIKRTRTHRASFFVLVESALNQAFKQCAASGPRQLSPAPEASSPYPEPHRTLCEAISRPLEDRIVPLHRRENSEAVRARPCGKCAYRPLPIWPQGRKP